MRLSTSDKALITGAVVLAILRATATVIEDNWFWACLAVMAIFVWIDVLIKVWTKD